MVFEYLDHLNLREYLRANKDAGRRKLVRLYSNFHYPSYSHLEASC